MMQFRNEQLDGWTTANVKKYELAIVKYMEKYAKLAYIRCILYTHIWRVYKSDRLTVYVLNNPYVESEMVRAGVSLMPYLVVGYGNRLPDLVDTTSY